MLDLEHVLFVPNADPPHKQDQVVTAARHRAAMVALAIAPEPAFVLSRIELERPGPSYAVDTVAAAGRRSRGARGARSRGSCSRPRCSRGSIRWREPERIWSCAASRWLPVPAPSRSIAAG